MFQDLQCYQPPPITLHVFLSVADGQQEALEVAAALVPQRVLQRHVVLFQIHVLDGLQVKLWGNIRNKLELQDLI